MGRQKQSGQILLESLIFISAILFGMLMLQELATQIEQKTNNEQLFGN